MNILSVHVYVALSKPNGEAECAGVIYVMINSDVEIINNDRSVFYNCISKE